MSAASQAAKLSPETWPLSPEQRVAAAKPALALVSQIAGALDVDRLRASLATVIARYDVLASAFVSTAGFRALRALPLDAATATEWTVRDLRGSVDPEREIARDIGTTKMRAFDVARGETLRAILWHTAEASWRLALVVSPLVADQGSLARLERALREAYAGTASSDGDEPTRYGQYAEWRRDTEADEDSEEGRRYWREHLAPASTLPPLHLPYRSDVGPGAPASIRAAIDPGLAARFAQAAGANDPVTCLQAAWWALIARISGRAAMLVAWRHDCRRDYDVFADTVGPMEKTLPLHLVLDGDETIVSLAVRLDERLGGHRGWQEHVATDLTEGRQPTIGFGLMPDLSLDPSSWSRLTIDAAPGFDLMLRPQFDGAGRLDALTLAYDDALYARAAAATLLEEMTTLLAAFADDSEIRVGAIAPVGPVEQARLLDLDRSAIVPPGRESILDALQRFAATTPTAPALHGGGTVLDYAGFVARIDRLARWLVGRGVAPEAIVGLDMPRSADMVVAMFAVWRAGAAYLPLDPAWPEARRRSLCDGAGAALVLSAGDVVTALAGPDAAADVALPAQVERRAAYVLFTSGSTGVPKAVVVEHAQIANYVAAARDALGLGVCRRFALTSTVAADLGNTMLFGAFAQGACLVVAEEDEARDGTAFAAFLRDKAVDCAKLAPSHLAALLDTDAPRVPATLIVGGEAASAALIARVLAIDPACRLANHYGPTETTIGVLVHVHGSTSPVPSSLPLTRVLDGNRAVILDAQGRLVPTGAVGVLHIGGAQLCRGYLGQDGAGFVDDPMRPGHVLYPTGDLARYRPEGGIALLGRADRQVKISGHRVEPAEVEAALAAVDGVRQAAVLVSQTETGARLVAFVTMAGAGDAASVRAALQARLPAPMVPDRVVVLGAMPLLPNGKLDRTRLDAAALETGAAIAVPRDALETMLRDAAADLLGRRPATLGVTDDFFDVGGHSLLAIKFVARIRKLFSLDVPPGIVFDHPTIAGLAEALRARAPGGRLDEVATLRLTLEALPEDERAALLEQAAR